MGALEPDDLPPELRDVVIPDDARELDRDRLAYYRELAARARADERPASPAARIRRLPKPFDPTRSPQFPSAPDGMITSLAIGVAVMVALFGALLLTFSVSGGPLPQTMPRATVDVPVGQPGGLLPDVPVVVNGLDRSTADVRPAVLVLWPAEGCGTGCEAALADVGRAAAEQRVRVVLAGTPEQGEDMRAAARQVPGSATWLTEPTGALSVVGPSGLTVVTVHADGVIGDVLRDVGPGTSYDGSFDTLSLPGAPAAAPAR